MEVTTTATQTTESTPTTQASQTSAAPNNPTTTTPDPVTGKETTPVTAETPEVPSYTPNFKFKTMDKELEFEDWAKGIIKDKDIEEKVRKMHSKAYGLESVQASRDSLRAEKQEIMRTLQESEKTINQIANFAKTGDFDSFFSAWDIPIEKVMKFALDYAQRTPEQQHLLEDKRRYQQEQNVYLQRLEQAEARAAQYEVRDRERDLHMELSRPEISQLAQAFDAKVNQPGKFRSEVIRLAKQHFSETNTDLSASEAVGEFVKYIGPFLQSMDGVQTSDSGTTSPRVVAPNQKPVIPNISGRGASVVKKSPKSLDDLRKLGEQFAASGG